MWMMKLRDRVAGAEEGLNVEAGERSMKRLHFCTVIIKTEDKSPYDKRGGLDRWALHK